MTKIIKHPTLGLTTEEVVIQINEEMGIINDKLKLIKKLLSMVGQKDKTVATPKPKPVDEIIDLFQEINNPGYKNLFRSTAQRIAVKTLLESYNKEEIKTMIGKVKNYNTMSYISSNDKIYSPFQLLENWQKVLDKELEIKQRPIIEAVLHKKTLEEKEYAKELVKQDAGMTDLTGDPQGVSIIN